MHGPLGLVRPSKVSRVYLRAVALTLSYSLAPGLCCHGSSPLQFNLLMLFGNISYKVSPHI